MFSFHLFLYKLPSQVELTCLLKVVLLKLVQPFSPPKGFFLFASRQKWQNMALFSYVNCVHSTISSGNCEVSKSEVERRFPPCEIRFQFFLLLRWWFYPFHVENNSRFSSWTLFQRNIDVYIKQRRSLRSTNETSCQRVQIPPKPVTREWCKSHSTSKYGKSDPHLIIAFELSLQDGRVCNNSANNYIHYLAERQDFITILQS